MMAGVRPLLLLLSSLSLWLLLSSLLYGGARALVIPLDAVGGDDSQCLAARDLNDTTTEYPADRPPCQTLNAVLGNQSCNLACSLDDGNSPPSHLILQLAPGVYHLPRCLGIFLATNLTIRSRGDAVGDVIIECAAFPNNDYYDNLYVCGCQGVRFEGLVFRRCGPLSPNVFFNHSSSLVFDNCTFTDNVGSCLQGQFCDDIILTNTHFLDNNNQQVAEPDVNETSIEELYDSITTGGGFTFFSRDQPVSIRIENCSFVNNSANRNDPNNSRPVLLKANGHGGGVLIRLANSEGSDITIVDSVFSDNRAQVDGGAIYMTISESVSGSSILLERNNFTSNVVEEASGGAVSINSFQISFNNTILVRNCNFVKNGGNAGGAFSIALYDSNINSSRNPDGVNFTDCNFIDNLAENEGTAVGLFSLVHVDQVGFPVGFQDCLFINNTSEGDTQDTSAIAAFRFPITFQGTNRFLGNLGGGVTLLNTQMRASGVLEFDRNTAVFGGGIAMDDRCLLELSPGTEISFTNNVARESGGGIYVEFPPIRFVVDIFNRLCFLQYRDPSGRDIPPQDWENVAISFINNTARLSGAAIYASDMQQCSWLGNYTTDSSLIFTLPPELADRSPFLYRNNTLFSENNLVNNSNLATAPSTIEIDVDYTMVQPGETLAIGLLARDQVSNAREAVWSLEAPNQDVNLDALSANRDTYVYAVPCAPCLNHTNTADCSCSEGPQKPPGQGEGEGEDQGEFSEDFTAEIRLNFSLLRTLGEIESQNLTIKGCHPGYVYNSVTGNCDCDTNNNDLLRCDDNNRYVYLREGIWGGVGGGRNLITERVQPGYVNCRPQGRLPGCLFEFDNPDAQCRSERRGRLCGTCQAGYGVTLDLQQCERNCGGGLAVFIIICLLVVIVSFLIMFFDIELPNELKGFVFYAQVIGLVYRPYAVVQTTTNAFSTFLSILVNLLGFSLPFPLCLSTKVPAHFVALLGYISPILAMVTVASYIFSARFSKRLSNRSSLKGITFLSLFIYKYIADTAFIFISCNQTEFGLVFQYDGSVKCTSPEFAVFALIGLLLVILFVTPAPFAVGYICFRRPQRFQQYADVLTKGLRPVHRWWGGWDIGRRLPFVFFGFFLVLLRPSLVLFLMSLAALTVLIVHLFVKPYEKMYINVIETAILLNLLMVTAAFLDPSGRPIPEWLSSILVILPYVYAVGYVIWRVSRTLWKRFGFKIISLSHKAETPPTKDPDTSVEGERVTGTIATGSSPPSTNSTEPQTASTELTEVPSSIATGSPPGVVGSPPPPVPPSPAIVAAAPPNRRPSAEPDHSFTMLREPLLDS